MVADQDGTPRSSPARSRRGGHRRPIAVAKTAGNNQVAVEFGGNVTDRATGRSGSRAAGTFVAMTLPLQLLLMVKARSALVKFGALLARCSLCARSRWR